MRGTNEINEVDCLRCPETRKIDTLSAAVITACDGWRGTRRELELWRAAAIAGWLLVVAVMLVAAICGR